MSIPNNTYGIAIIGDGQITTSSGSRPYPTGDILNVTGLAHIALAKVDGQRAMWIAPGSDLDRKAHDPKFWKEFQLGPEPNWNVFATGPQDSVPNAASVRRTGKGAHKEDRREVMIYADLDTRWALETGYPAAFTPALMLQCIEAYERHMGVQARFTPASTALALLQKLHTDCSSVAYLDPLSREAMDSIPWPIARAPGHANQYARDGKYVHVFDKRSAYMASAMGEVGRGDPVHVADVGIMDDPNPEWQQMIDKEVPGLWCITADKGPRVPNVTTSADALPSPFNSHGDLPDHEWYYGPQIKLARQMGYLITIHEGYYWPKHHRTLRPWVERLWQARQAVRGTPTEAMIKASFTRSLGVMARPVGPTERLQWYHRPDWNGLITAQHYLRHTRKIIEMEATHPGYLAESTDSVAWISDDPNWATALPAGWMGKPGQLGEYRHMGTYRGHDAQTLITMAREGASAARIYKQMNEWDEVEDDGPTT